MSSTACGFRNRLIAVSICLCAFLAFSTTLSADTYSFVPGVGVSGISYLGNSGIGPYGGTLTDTTSNKVLADSIFFCLTGNVGYNSTENDNPGQSSLAPSTVPQEEAAFLYSLMLSDEAANSVTLTTTGTGNSKAVVVNGTAGNIAAFDADLGPIQFAIWYVMGTLPSTQASAWGYSGTLASGFTNITDLATRADVKAAETPANYTPFANNTEYQVFVTTSGGQSFIGAVPEPSTMVLFGAGGLLMALGCARRRLTKRVG
jgi:PEP-CTERM motif